MHVYFSEPRPDFHHAASTVVASALYTDFVSSVRSNYLPDKVHGIL